MSNYIGLFNKLFLLLTFACFQVGSAENYPDFELRSMKVAIHQPYKAHQENRIYEREKTYAQLMLFKVLDIEGHVFYPDSIQVKSETYQSPKSPFELIALYLDAVQSKDPERLFTECYPPGSLVLFTERRGANGMERTFKGIKKHLSKIHTIRVDAFFKPPDPTIGLIVLARRYNKRDELISEDTMILQHRNGRWYMNPNPQEISYIFRLGNQFYDHTIRFMEVPAGPLTTVGKRLLGIKQKSTTSAQD